MIATRKDKDADSEDLEVREIPASTWAIFESVGAMPSAIQKVWSRIFTEWFPSAGYEHADAPELEVYPKGNVNDENYRCEIWFHVVKK